MDSLTLIVGVVRVPAGAGIVAAGDEACHVCGRACQPRLKILRPAFSLAGRSERDAQVVGTWLGRTPEHLTSCVSHLLSQASAIIVAPGGGRLWRSVASSLFFDLYGHPLASGRTLWRPARRTPLAIEAAAPQQPAPGGEALDAAQQRPPRYKRRRTTSHTRARWRSWWTRTGRWRRAFFKGLARFKDLVVIYAA